MKPLLIAVVMAITVSAGLTALFADDRRKTLSKGDIDQVLRQEVSTRSWILALDYQLSDVHSEGRSRLGSFLQLFKVDYGSSVEEIDIDRYVLRDGGDRFAVTIYHDDGEHPAVVIDHPHRIKAAEVLHETLKERFPGLWVGTTKH